jgi:hypothetical protein
MTQAELKREYDKKWYRDNREHKLTYLKEYFERNPEKRKWKPKPPKTYSNIHIKTCAITGKLFISRNSNAKYSKEGSAIKAKDTATKFYHTNKVLVATECKVCIECGIGFIGKPRSRYCSIDCSKRVEYRTKHAKERASPLTPNKEPIGRHVVYERFNGHCAICGIHTPKGLVGTLNAPELDHIIPLTKGGAHTYSNIQLLCRACNLKKGDNVL